MYASRFLPWSHKNNTGMPVLHTLNLRRRLQSSFCLLSLRFVVLMALVVDEAKA